MPTNPCYKWLSHNLITNGWDQFQGPSPACKIGRKQPLNRAVTIGTKKGKNVQKTVRKGNNMSIKRVNQPG